jgi:hypothetical protein
MNKDDPISHEDGVNADPAAPLGEAGVSNRRRLLMLGAISASAVVTIRPALAQTAGSVLNCQIQVPDPARAGNWISTEGKLVAPATPGAFPPAPRPLTGEEVRAALNSRSAYRGIEYDASQAYTNYIRRLQIGTSGFTCYASLQMPRG